MRRLSWQVALSRSGPRWGLGLVIALFMASAALLHWPLVGRLDDTLQDQLIAAFAPGTAHPGQQDAAGGHTVFVDIDDVSLSAVGQWPWPRYHIASLIQRIAADGPAAIALDIVFPEADRVSLATLRATFQHDFGLALNFSGIPTGLDDNDAYLAHSIRSTQAIGARYFYFDHRNTAPIGPTTAAAVPAGADDDSASPLLQLRDPAGLLKDVDTAQGALDSVASIAGHTRRTGFLNSRADADGVLRRLPLLIRHQGELQPSLGLAAAMQALHATRGEVLASRDGPSLRLSRQDTTGRNNSSSSTADTVTSALVPDIPLDTAARTPLRWLGGASVYARVPALALLNHAVEPGRFAGKVVFIGASASGLHDHQRTALEAQLPGTLAHAALAEAILGGHHLRQPAWAPTAGALACLIAAALLSWAAGVGLAALLATGAALAAVLLGAGTALYALAGLLLPVGAALLTVLLLFVGLLVQRAWAEQRRIARYRHELAKAREITIEAMAAVAETRDPETGAHIKRTQHYVRAIAEELRRCGQHSATLTPEYIDLLFLSAPLHDIGKVGVPDRILLKPGRLAHDEMVEMKQHAEYGRRIVAGSARRLEGDNFLTIAGEIAGTHHEKWDGSGYPLGLAGPQIPLSGRIMAVADVYDALISRRCYKEPFPHDTATALMREWRATTFDPAVLDAFFRIEDQIKDIAARYSDAPTADPSQHHTTPP